MVFVNTLGDFWSVVVHILWAFNSIFFYDQFYASPLLYVAIY
jgi:hypothetical protein